MSTVHGVSVLRYKSRIQVVLGIVLVPSGVLRRKEPWERQLAKRFLTSKRLTFAYKKLDQYHAEGRKKSQ